MQNEWQVQEFYRQGHTLIWQKRHSPREEIAPVEVNIMLTGGTLEEEREIAKIIQTALNAAEWKREMREKREGREGTQQNQKIQEEGGGKS